MIRGGGGRGTWVRNLRLHMESKHDGVIYHCLEYDQLPQTTAQTLKVQIKYKLKGVRYSCDKYDLTTATICHLKHTLRTNMKACDIHVIYVITLQRLIPL